MNWNTIDYSQNNKLSFTEFSKMAFERTYAWWNGFVSGNMDDNETIASNKIEIVANIALHIIDTEIIEHFKFSNLKYNDHHYLMDNDFHMTTNGFIDFINLYFEFDKSEYASDIYSRLPYFTANTVKIHDGINRAAINWASELTNAIFAKDPDFKDYQSFSCDTKIRIVNKNEYMCDKCLIVELSCGFTKNGRDNFTVCENCGHKNATIIQKIVRGRNQRWRTPLHLFNI
jgi:hypothetical protein